MNIINVISKDILEALRSDSSFTIVTDKELSSSTQFLNWFICRIKEASSISSEELYIINGTYVNNVYGLTGNNAYSNDAVLISVKLPDTNECDPVNLAAIKRELSGRWLDDIISNKVRNENARMAREFTSIFKKLRSSSESEVM